jgi:serine/threonine-protein kinase
VHWRLRSRPEGAKVVRIADGSAVGQTPLDEEAEQSSEPLRLRVELAGHLPREIQISLEASSEVQVVLLEEPPKPPPVPEVKPVEPKAKLPVKKTKRPKDAVPHIEN